VTQRSLSKPVSTLPYKLLLVLLFVIWSNAFTAIKYLREIFSPIELVCARFLPAALFCLIALVSRERTRRESVEALRRGWLGLIGMGAAGVAGYNIFLVIGQGEIKPGAAALLTTLSPLFTLILAIVFLKERVPWKRALGIALAFAGLYVVVQWGGIGLGRMSVSHAEVRYAVVTALAPLCWTIYTILGKTLVRNGSPLVVTYLSLVIGAAPFIAAINARFIDTLLHMEPRYWVALFHLTALCTIVGFSVWNTALRHLPATTTASFIYLNPPLAALFGFLFFDEEMTATFLAGSAVVLAGLYLAQRTDAPRPGEPGFGPPSPRAAAQGRDDDRMAH
jgi:drug/metabolite transporter (DMT)-like permease